MKKLIPILLCLALCLLLFTGCVGTSIVTTVDRDGRITTHALSGTYLEETDRQPNAVIEINGKRYALELDQTRTFVSPSEFELSFEQVTEDEDGFTSTTTVNIPGVSMTKTDTGLILTLDLTVTTADEDYAEIIGKEELTEDEQRVIDTVETMLYFNMPPYSEIKQTQGFQTGVKITSNSLTVNLMEILTTIQEPCVYEFEIAIPEIDEFVFDDVMETDWFFTAVDKAARAGIIQGYPNHSFGPDNRITYAEFAQMVARHEEWPTGESDGVWYGKAVDSCIEHGIIEEQPNYGKPISREEAVYGLALLKTWNTDPVRSITIENIPDGGSIRPEYADKIVEMYNFGGCNGYDAALTFHPNSDLSRAEVAQLFLNLDFIE